MNINWHPFLVHFPIAFLFMYGVLESLRFRRLSALPYWFHIKGALLFFGVGGGMLALQSGELLEGAFRGTPSHALVEMHSLWGAAAVNIFAVMLAAYAVRWVGITDCSGRLFRFSIIGPLCNYLWPWLNRLSGWLLDSPLAVLVSVAGMVSLLFAGALGGAIVYGPEVDPVVYFIYKLFF